MSRRVRSLLLVAAVVALGAVGTALVLDEPQAPSTPSAKAAVSGPGVTVAPVLQRAGRKRPVLASFGVASANAYRFLDFKDAKSDWDRLTARDGLDLIGWQESKSSEFRALYPRYLDKGWDTWFWSNPDTGPISLAFSCAPRPSTSSTSRPSGCTRAATRGRPPTRSLLAGW